MDFALTFRRTEAHYDEVQKALTRPRTRARTALRFLSGLSVPFAAAFIGIVAALIIRHMPAEMWRYIASASLCGASAAILFVLVLRPAAPGEKKPSPSDRGSFLTGWQVTTSHDGIIEKGNGWQRAYTWQALLGMRALKTGYVLLHDATDGVFIPYTAFTNDAHQRTFEEFMQERVVVGDALVKSH